MRNRLSFILILLAFGTLMYSIELNKQTKEYEEQFKTPVIASTTKSATTDNTAKIPVTVDPISHATMVLSWDALTVYVDPVGGKDALKGRKNPDLILVTDIHGDHLDIKTLEAIVGSSTIIAPLAVVNELSPTLKNKTIVLSNNTKTDFKGLSIEAVPMYNVPEEKDSKHVKGRGNGYVIEKENYRLYIAGDTGATKEMKALKDIDMAFIPMNLPYTMSVEDAALGVLAFKPRIVYPYHYRTPTGFSDVALFKKLVQEGNGEIEVIPADWYKKAN